MSDETAPVEVTRSNIARCLAASAYLTEYLPELNSDEQARMEPALDRLQHAITVSRQRPPITRLPRFRDRFTDEEWAARQEATRLAVEDEHSHGGTPTLDDGC